MHQIGTLLLLLLAFPSSAAPVYAAERPPNIVVFLIDDLGATDLGCYGSTFYETPNVDRLAADGMRFTSAYSTCPVCSPTRASMVTGRYPQRVGITDFISHNNHPGTWDRNTRLLPAEYSNQLPHEEYTIAEALRDRGYDTYFAGKWHLGGTGYLPTDHGFQTNAGGFGAGSPRNYFSPYQNPFLKDGPDGEELPIRLAQETCDFLDQARDKPFLVYFPFYSVHTPLQTTKELEKKYADKAAATKSDKPEWAPEHDRQVRLVQNHPTFAGMVEQMDTAVGMVLDKLDQLGLADNTIVLFTSDNGGLSTSEGSPTSNVPLRAGKGWLYEGGVRVASIIRWPGVTKAGSMSDTPITANDYFPTFVAAAGGDLKPELKIDGVDISPLLRGEAIAERPIFWHYPHYGNQGGRPGGAVRDGRWKLIDWYEDQPLELYNLAADLSETQNVAAENPDVTARLEKLLNEWRKDVGAKMPTPNPKYDPDKQDGKKKNPERKKHRK